MEATQRNRPSDNVLFNNRWLLQCAVAGSRGEQSNYTGASHKGLLECDVIPSDAMLTWAETEGETEAIERLTCCIPNPKIDFNATFSENNTRNFKPFTSALCQGFT